MQGRLVERGEGRWAVEFPRDDGTSEPAVLPIEANHGTAQHALKLLQAHALIRAGQDAAARPLLRDLEVRMQGASTRNAHGSSRCCRC